MKAIITISVCFSLLAILGAYIYPSVVIDSCLDSGGSFDYEKCECDYTNSHPFIKNDNCDFTRAKMEWLKLIAVLGAVVIILVGLALVFARLKAKEQGFGPNSLRAIGIVIFVPVLLILAIVTEFKTETLAALLGTVAGYVLSNSKPDDN